MDGGRLRGIGVVAPRGKLIQKCVQVQGQPARGNGIAEVLRLIRGENRGPKMLAWLGLVYEVEAFAQDRQLASCPLQHHLVGFRSPDLCAEL